MRWECCWGQPGWPGAHCETQAGPVPAAGSGPGRSLMDEQTQRAPALPAAKVAACLPWISLCASCSRAELFVLLRTIPGFGGGRWPTERAVTERDVGPVPWRCGLACRQRALAGGCVPSTPRGTSPTALLEQPPPLSPQPDKGGTEQRVKPEPFICVSQEQKEEEARAGRAAAELEPEEGAERKRRAGPKRPWGEPGCAAHGAVPRWSGEEGILCPFAVGGGGSSAAGMAHLQCHLGYCSEKRIHIWVIAQRNGSTLQQGGSPEDGRAGQGLGGERQLPVC